MDICITFYLKPLTLPTAVEPVKDTLEIWLLVQIVSLNSDTWDLLHVTKLNNPGGIPPWANTFTNHNTVTTFKISYMSTSAMTMADKGVSSEGLVTTLQPAAKAADALRSNMAQGKFH